ncbi:MAG: hypothetical protein J0I04_02445 [Paenarthrobacter ureafaciens]|uniref:hypothetical protein n=1 Tax=Paenarthrobacter ureafaciens TaxID=37931 RepID=UPI001AC700C0|nr:hypothetical protein [Paenarthrobacter ureafaciens]MBN9128498.1 hypothetical protein [Paenarthrobacter ureafaciens]
MATREELEAALERIGEIIQAKEEERERIVQEHQQWLLTNLVKGPVHGDGGFVRGDIAGIQASLTRVLYPVHDQLVEQIQELDAVANPAPNAD